MLGGSEGNDRKTSKRGGKIVCFSETFRAARSSQWMYYAEERGSDNTPWQQE